MSADPDTLNPAAQPLLMGVWHGIENNRYHSMPGLSHTGAKRLRQATPYHFHAFEEPPEDKPAPVRAPSPQMVNGTLVHCATLEPDQFDKRYRIGPDVHRNSGAWREFAAGCVVDSVEAITQDQRTAAHAQADSLRRLPEVAELLREGHPEVSAWWTDPVTGVLCKCRPDWVHAAGKTHAGVVLLDVKTTGDASPEQFARSCAEFGYHTQADWYTDGYSQAAGLPVFGMLFAAVESSYPYAAAAFMFSDMDLVRARVLNERARRLYAACKAANDWPGYPAGINVIALPHWAY